mmetsp:Transcript_5960/g.14152  ORF Transcript_5960/g.14152 Transcript_5960/m.14152 type:complete len:402 (-) Transcript_5960:1504-2709(-)
MDDWLLERVEEIHALNDIPEDGEHKVSVQLDALVVNKVVEGPVLHVLHDQEGGGAALLGHDGPDDGRDARVAQLGQQAHLLDKGLVEALCLPPTAEVPQPARGEATGKGPAVPQQRVHGPLGPRVCDCVVRVVPVHLPLVGVGLLHVLLPRHPPPHHGALRPHALLLRHNPLQPNHERAPLRRGDALALARHPAHRHPAARLNPNGTVHRLQLRRPRRLGQRLPARVEHGRQVGLPPINRPAAERGEDAFDGDRRTLVLRLQDLPEGPDAERLGGVACVLDVFLGQGPDLVRPLPLPQHDEEEDHEGDADGEGEEDGEAHAGGADGDRAGDAQAGTLSVWGPQSVVAVARHDLKEERGVLEVLPPDRQLHQVRARGAHREVVLVREGDGARLEPRGVERPL